MKKNKIVFSIFLFLLLMPFVVQAETCDMNKVSIESVSIKDKTDNVKELSQPVISGKMIKVNLRMLEVNDYIEYNLLLKNDSNEDYELDSNSFSSHSDYVEYTLNTNDDNLIVKAGTSKEVYLRVQYKNAVPEGSFTNGKYNDNNNFVLNLSSNTGTINNPNTSGWNLVLILIFVLCLGFVIYVVVSQKKYNQLIILLLGVLLFVPTSIYALCKVEINVDSKVEIAIAYPVNYIIDETIKTSEKSNYSIFNYSSFGIDEPSCRLVNGKDGYELCFIIYSRKMYMPGENVEVLDKMTYHAFNGEGQLIKNTVPINNTKQEGIWDYDYVIDLNTVYTNQYNIWYCWAYNKDLNNYDDVNEFNFTGIINNRWNDSSWPIVEMYAPNSFTMPPHGVFFELSEKHGSESDS